MESLVLAVQDFFTTAFAGLLTAGGILLIIGSIFIGVLLAFFIRIFIAYRMAENRHREPLPWVLLSFCFSPVLTWIILLIIGDRK